LDACVLLPMPLADTLLRLAEHPRLYLPQWTDDIMREVTRNLVNQWQVSPERAKHREAELRKHFPEAWVTGYETLIPAMSNDKKDRHVLAAAVRCKASVIITYNTKDFDSSALARWQVECQGPSTFLRTVYDSDADLVLSKLHQQAGAIGLTLEQLLARLQKNVPAFVSHLCSEHGMPIGMR
jgi:predicted nucleic acid-binding protein